MTLTLQAAQPVLGVQQVRKLPCEASVACSLTILNSWQGQVELSNTHKQRMVMSMLCWPVNQQQFT
jgi:hypothetical protein